MKCKDCALCWANPDEDFPSCKADPNWPAPCELEEEEEVEDRYTLEDLGPNWW